MGVPSAWAVPRKLLPSMATSSPAVSRVRWWPVQKTLLQFRRVQRLKHAVERIVRGDAVRQLEEAFPPRPLGLAVALDLIPAAGPAQNRRNRDQNNILQQMTPRSFYTRILQLRKIPQGFLQSPISAWIPHLHIAIKMRLPCARSARRASPHVFPVQWGPHDASCSSSPNH